MTILMPMVKVYIVEDDPLMSRMYEKIFTFENYEVELADNGKDALDNVVKINPDIILLDVMMPKMNGLQVLELLKSDSTTNKIPVIMLTNLTGQEDAQKAISKGAINYIVKSEHEPKEIVNMVKEVIDGQKKSKIPINI